MFRMFDVECRACGEIYETVVEYPQGESPREFELTCEECDVTGPHDRLISLVGPYTGEMVHNPMVSGGSFDTTGHASLPPLPDVATGGENSFEAHRDLFASPDWKEAKKARRAAQKQNAAKQQRAAAIKRGENYSIKRDKLPGDPAFT